MKLLGQARQAASGRKSLGVGFCHQSWREHRILPTIAAGIVTIAGSEPFLSLCYQWLRLSSTRATYNYYYYCCLLNRVSVRLYCWPSYACYSALSAKLCFHTAVCRSKCCALTAKRFLGGGGAANLWFQARPFLWVQSHDQDAQPIRYGRCFHGNFLSPLIPVVVVAVLLLF